ncbi:MAG: hypothetical protein M5U08_12410 [Burkholderiales bacterium]|nr:hypothetical protein [Burkholderiales bacterium]
MLALDTGLSQTDLDIWRQHLAPTSGHEDGCFAVLNKIDTLWDGLRSEEEIAHHVRRQARQVGDSLGLGPSQILPVSALKGLIAKVIGDEKLLASSGLPLLENALAARVLPAKHELTRGIIRSEISALLGITRAVLETRIAWTDNALAELKLVRGDKVEAGHSLLERAFREKMEFESKLADFQALRSVLTEKSNALFAHLGTDALDAELKNALTSMTESNFTVGIRRAMRRCLEELRAKLDASNTIVGEVHAMMVQASAEYGARLGLRLDDLPTLSLERPARRMARVEQTFRRRFDTISMMLTYEQMSLTRRFFRTVAAEIRDIFLGANLEATFWLRAVVAPLESQISERQSQLRQRMRAVKRLKDASEKLEDQIADLEYARRSLAAQLESLQAIAAEIEFALNSDSRPLAQAA